MRNSKTITGKIESFFVRLSSARMFCILFVVGFVAYGKSIFYSFVHDDLVFILGDVSIGNWNNLSEIFLTPSRPLEPILGLVNSYYRPLLSIVYKVQYLIFQNIPYGYHLTNIVLHIANSWFLYLLAVLITKRVSLSFWVAILFLVHPVQTEAVCAIAGISNLLLTLFCILSLLFYACHDKGRKKSRILVWYAASLITFVLALLTKEQAIIIPGLLACYEIWSYCYEKNKQRVGQVVQRLIPFLIILLLYFGLRRILFESTLFEVFSYQEELWLRIYAIPKTLLMYFRILIFPEGLHYYRSVDILSRSIAPAIILSALAILFGGVVRFFSRENRGIVFFGTSWFFVSIFPTLNIVPLINEYSLILTSEHFLM